MCPRTDKRDGFPGFLAQVFPSLSQEEIGSLAEIILQIHYEEDELVAQEGSYASGIYIVRSGLLSIGKYASKGWEKRCLRFLAAGEMFGLEAVFLEREPVNVQYAKAIVESTLVFFERSNILAFGKEHPRIFTDLCRWLAREVIMLEFKLTREAVESMDRNLALLLISLGNKYGEKEEGGIRLELPISRQTMAEVLGVSVETLMRGLKRFRELKLIATSHNMILIQDIDTLTGKARVSDFYLSIMEETL
jgi:CRP-like cAMP-binding protein